MLMREVMACVRAVARGGGGRRERVETCAAVQKAATWRFSTRGKVDTITQHTLPSSAATMKLILHNKQSLLCYTGTYTAFLASLAIFCDFLENLRGRRGVVASLASNM